MDAKRIGKIYDKFASKYDARSFLLEKFVLAKIRRNIFKELNGDILEVGVGSGKNLDFYKKSVNLTAVDVGSKMIKIAEKKAKSLRLNARFCLMDAANLEFPDESFDAVVETLCLCTFPDPIKTIQEMARVLKQGGCFVFIDHGISSYSFVRGWQKIFKGIIYKKCGCRLNSNPLVLIKEAGLKIEHLERRVFGIFYIITAIKS